MKNTIDALRYGMETLNVSQKELFSLIESSKGYDGEEYDRWLANEIIKIAEKDGVGYSQLLAKWFNIIQSIIEEYSDTSIKECYDKKIREMISGTKVFTVGFSQESNYGESLDEVDWGTGLDLPYNLDFIDNLPDSIKDAIHNEESITVMVKFNPKSPFKKSCDLVSDAKLNTLSLKNNDSLMMYRMCTIVRALGDSYEGFNFLFITDTKFLYNEENQDIIKYFLSYFNYQGFTVNSKDLYKGSYTSEDYAIIKGVMRVGGEVQDGIVLRRSYEKDGELLYEKSGKRYSKGSDMLSALFKKYSDLCINSVPVIDRSFNRTGNTVKGCKDALGYLCKGEYDRSAILSSYPIENTDYIPIIEDNLNEVIAYFGVTRSMDSSGMFLGITEIIDGHPEYTNLVSNCVPIFFFDVNSKFCSLPKISSKTGKVTEFPNRLDIPNPSPIVSKLLDKSSVYFSYEAKELMNICKGVLEKTGYLDSKPFDDLRREYDDGETNRAYLNALSRCKEYIISLYRQM